jgi:hypothetical protein
MRKESASELLLKQAKAGMTFFMGKPAAPSFSIEITP